MTKKRILIIEDDAALARVLRDNFVFEGFEVMWLPDVDMNMLDGAGRRLLDRTSTNLLLMGLDPILAGQVAGWARWSEDAGSWES